ncbi:guanylate kinase [Zwartia sp.]|uniref:guanylate kinase n=1 Tax=Zwartia sp. TaxID=2978004 RepID=UPI0027186B0F|nr:guanylate kinase [Zwartia sp.]MDO9023250.1 guanylate kinase [Zwartia sp.]
MSLVAGNVFMVVAPSGAGKSSLVNALLARDPTLCLSVSCTTRAPRSGEIDGKDYRFVSKTQFESMRQQQQLLEWAEVHGNFYGTPRDKIDQAVAFGQDILLEIDWQGARQVKKLFPEAIGVFILPPSIATLRERLTQRGQDDDAVIERRIEAASEEISHAPEFEYVIINQDFSIALTQLTQIIETAKLRYPRQLARHTDLFRSFDLLP